MRAATSLLRLLSVHASLIMLAAVLGVGCGGGGGGSSSDAGVDGANDATADAASTDAEADGSTDAGADGSTDAGADGSTDAGADGSTDAGADGSTDAGADGSTDAGADGSTDAGADGSTDAGADAASDGGGGRDGAADAAMACPGLRTLCGGVCVTTTVDPLNCGACGVVCGAAEVCSSSGCASTCPAPLSACGGTCVDTDTDSAHCGACGVACAAGEGCIGGACQPSVTVGPAPARCEGGGPPIVVMDGTGADRCADGTAAISFTYGLCSCAEIGLPMLSSETEIDAYDSAAGPYAPGPGGSMGANGRIRTAQLRLSGDLRSGGAGALQLSTTAVARQLHVAGDTAASGATTVGEDAFAAGAMSGSIAVAGTLHTPDCSAVPGSVSSASCVSEVVAVPPPCACDAADVVPIGAIVSFYSDAAHNDNAAISLASDVFASVGGPRRLDLPCGFYYLDQILGAVTIVAHGRSALFVGGNIDANSAMAFAVDPGATLDVYVAGTLHAEARLRVGSPSYPRNIRFYVGGTDPSFTPARSVNLESDVDLAGLFYAPNGAFVSSSTLEMYGAIFAGSFHNSSSTFIHYDRAATDLGADCPDPHIPPPVCTTCRDCGNQACVAGECGACVTDKDCCSPLRCVSGSCTSGLI